MILLAKMKIFQLKIDNMIGLLSKVWYVIFVLHWCNLNFILYSSNIKNTNHSKNTTLHGWYINLWAFFSSPTKKSLFINSSIRCFMASFSRLIFILTRWMHSLTSCWSKNFRFFMMQSITWHRFFLSDLFFSSTTSVIGTPILFFLELNLWLNSRLSPAVTVLLLNSKLSASYSTRIL